MIDDKNKRIPASQARTHTPHAVENLRCVYFRREHDAGTDLLWDADLYY